MIMKLMLILIIIVQLPVSHLEKPLDVDFYSYHDPANIYLFKVWGSNSNLLDIIPNCYISYVTKPRLCNLLV